MAEDSIIDAADDFLNKLPIPFTLSTILFVADRILWTRGHVIYIQKNKKRNELPYIKRGECRDKTK